MASITNISPSAMMEHPEHETQHTASELATNAASGQEIPSHSASPPAQILLTSASTPSMENPTTEQPSHGSSLIASNATAISLPAASDASIPLRPNSLSRIPAELKQTIFALAGGSHEAVVAFRGDPGTYKDALKAYYELSRFNVPHDFRLEKCALSTASLNSLKKLRVNLEYLVDVQVDGIMGRPHLDIWIERYGDGLNSSDANPDAFWTLGQFLSLNTLDIEVYLNVKYDFYHQPGDRHIDTEMEGIKGTFWEGYLARWTSGRLAHYVCIFQRVFSLMKHQKTSLTKIAIEISWAEEDRDFFDDHLCFINLNTGIPGKLKTVGTGKTGIFFWEAEEGEVLQWHDYETPGWED